MEKKIDGRALKANDAKPIIQKNVPGFQDKCSKEIINAYNRVSRLDRDNVGTYFNVQSRCTNRTKEST